MSRCQTGGMHWVCADKIAVYALIANRNLLSPLRSFRPVPALRTFAPPQAKTLGMQRRRQRCCIGVGKVVSVFWMFWNISDSLWKVTHVNTHHTCCTCQHQEFEFTLNSYVNLHVNGASIMYIGSHEVPVETGGVSPSQKCCRKRVRWNLLWNTKRCVP